MKYSLQIIGVVLCILVTPQIGKSQTIVQKDTTVEAAIQKVILGYITNFFLNDYEKMEGNLHERLSKRGVKQDGKLSEDYSKEKLHQLLKSNRPLPLEYQKNEITRVEVYGDVALAILETGYPSVRWTEYIHLAKLEDNWIIMDVFWSFYEEE